MNGGAVQFYPHNHPSNQAKQQQQPVNNGYAYSQSQQPVAKQADYEYSEANPKSSSKVERRTAAATTMTSNTSNTNTTKYTPASTSSNNGSAKPAATSAYSKTTSVASKAAEKSAKSGETTENNGPSSGAVSENAHHLSKSDSKTWASIVGVGATPSNAAVAMTTTPSNAAVSMANTAANTTANANASANYNNSNSNHSNTNGKSGVCSSVSPAFDASQDEVTHDSHSQYSGNMPPPPSHYAPPSHPPHQHTYMTRHFYSTTRLNQHMPALAPFNGNGGGGGGGGSSNGNPNPRPFKKYNSYNSGYKQQQQQQQTPQSTPHVEFNLNNGAFPPISVNCKTLVCFVDCLLLIIQNEKTI